MKKKSSVILGACLIGILVTAFKPNKYCGVVGYPSTYKYIHRNLKLKNFEEIDLGTNYDTIVSKLGEPNGEVGSGIIWPYYQLSDGSCIILLFNKAENKRRNLTTLKDIYIVDTKGRIYELK